LASHSMTDEYSNGSTYSYSSAGLSLGLDYQFAVSSNFSISPFLLTSGESTNISNVTANHGVVGVQFRYWVGDAFFGGQIGGYSQVLTFTSGSLSVSGSGSGGGAGLVAGWENPDGGLYVMGQVDSAKIKYSTPGQTKMNAFRLSVGYRWK